MTRAPEFMFASWVCSWAGDGGAGDGTGVVVGDGAGCLVVGGVMGGVLAGALAVVAGALVGGAADVVSCAPHPLIAMMSTTPTVPTVAIELFFGCIMFLFPVTFCEGSPG